MEMWAIATASLVAGLIDDLRSRKIHNPLVICLFVIVAVGNLYFRGFEGTAIGMGAMLLALIVTIPLFMAGIWGGGDVKLFAIFAFALEPVSMFWTLIYSFIWGGVFGLTRAALQKNLIALVKNTYRIAVRQRAQVQEVYKIPYSFAMLLGWFTQLTFLRAGVLL